MTNASLTPIQRARNTRDAKLQAAQDTYSESVRAAQSEFAQEIKRANKTRPMTHIANELGVGRQSLHNLIRQHCSA